MIGPRLIPEADRFALYQAMVRSPMSFSEKDLALIIQNGRRDARLAEVVTEHIRDYWWKYNPELLNRRLRTQPWGAAIKPILNQIDEFCDAPSELRLEFQAWARTVIRGVRNSPPQLYFYDDSRPRSRSQNREVDEALVSFLSAGYVAKDYLFNKSRPKSIGQRPTASTTTVTRADLLKESISRDITQRVGGLSLKEVSQRYGIDRTTMSKIRSGKVSGMSVDRLSEISDRLVRGHSAPSHNAQF